MKTRATRKAPEILNRGNLMTFRDGEIDRCLGYLMEFPGDGIYEPNFGKLDVSSEDANTHNQCLSQGEIAGLDQNCEVGMGGLFYVGKTNGQTRVVTWLNQEVSRDVRIHGAVLTFGRNGRQFRGRLQKDDDSFAFRRVR
jgi:hypothetical protein